MLKNQRTARELALCSQDAQPKIDLDKIREVIGKGGSVQKIQAECNCKIDIEEDGGVFISALNIEDGKRAYPLLKPSQRIGNRGDTKAAPV